MHRENIERVVDETLQAAQMSVEDVDAIAVTNRPGKTKILLNTFQNPILKTKLFEFSGIHECLRIGVRYARHLARKYKKPIIPIHHMEAHALTARMENLEQLQFPFLCLLASGGHCQLAIVKSVTEFRLLGEALDKSPGACLDRVARVLRLQTLPEYRGFSGGKAIEAAAYKSMEPDRFAGLFNSPLLTDRNCHFSFSGFMSQAFSAAEELRQTSNLQPNEMIPFHEDFCASFLKGVTKHILQRTQRAMRYCERTGLFGYGDNKLTKSFVLSGGVACNDFLFRALTEMMDQFGYKTFRPTKRLCSDNGIMIAWNGIERWQQNADEYKNLDIDSVFAYRKIKLGVDYSEEVEKMKLQTEKIKIPCMMANSMK